jgi:hypothetical protein
MTKAETKRLLFTLPLVEPKEPLESNIEAYGNARLKLYGYTNFKMKTANNRGLPDRAYVGEMHDPRRHGLDHKLFFCIEYKRIVKGKATEPTPKQLAWHNRLQKAGIPVLVIDSKEQVDRYFPKPKKEKP